MEEPVIIERPPISPDDFKRLIDRAKCHDEEAIAELYNRALPSVYRYVSVRLHKPQLVEDIVSEIFLGMVESIAKINAEHEAGFFAWLFTVAHGKVVNRLKKLASQDNRLVPLPSFYEGPDETHLAELAAQGLENDPEGLQEWQETIGELGAALETLTEDQRHVVFGRFIRGLSIRRLAQDLRREEGAIRALQFRALESLAQRMGMIRGKTERRTDRKGKRA